jgi:glutamyl-tRNA synthetase
VLRVEDTDRQRSTEANVEAILDGMDWLGLDPDEGPYFQTNRFDRYLEVADEWLATGAAYHCYCSKERLAELRERQLSSGGRLGYDGRCRDGAHRKEGIEPVVRFRNPVDGEVFVDDAVRGKVKFENAQLDDLIIVRSDGSPTYNFTVIIDDFDMEISHVIRGDDHLNNTPRQINMLSALGATPPIYAHLPMILGADGAKLSKRHGAVDIREYRDLGYLPNAMLNYLVRLGWSHGDQEVFQLDEMIELFDIQDVNQTASTFNSEKLSWINQQHIMAMPVDKLGELLEPQLQAIGLDPAAGPDVAHTASGFRERAVTLAQMANDARYCYEDFETVDAKAAKKHLRPVILEPLRVIRSRFELLDDWDTEKISEAISEVASQFELSLGKLGQPIRVAITGGSVSPPIDTTVWLVGKRRVLQRLDSAIVAIEARAAGAS